MHQSRWAGIASVELSLTYLNTQQQWDTQSQLDIVYLKPMS